MLTDAQRDYLMLLLLAIVVGLLLVKLATMGLGGGKTASS